MPDLTKLHYENEDIKIEAITSKEQVNELVKNSKNVSKKMKKMMKKDIEKSLNQRPRILLIKCKKTNELLGEICVLQTTRDGTVVGIMPELYVHKTTTSQYGQVIQFINSSLEVLGCKKLVIMAMHDDHVDTLLELGFCTIQPSNLKEYFGHEMLIISFTRFNIKGFLTKNIE